MLVGFASKVGPLCWERGRPVRSEREARRRSVVFRESGLAGSGRDVRAPSILRPSAFDFWGKVMLVPQSVDKTKSALRTFPRRLFLPLWVGESFARLMA